MVPISSATEEASTPSPMTGGATMRILGLPPGPQQSVVWAFCTRRRIPRLIAKAFMPKRSLLSLVPSMMISRLTGSWLFRQGQR